MIQIRPGDLVAVEQDGRYYYAVILDRVRFFGGNWVYVFHRTSTTPLGAAGLLAGPQEGFHAFVDFIWSKREKRLTRLVRGIKTSTYAGPGYLKKAQEIKGKARAWFISDMEFRPVRRVTKLSEEEKRYPLEMRIDDVGMTRRVDEKWRPEADERI